MRHRGLIVLFGIGLLLAPIRVRASCKCVCTDPLRAATLPDRPGRARNRSHEIRPALAFPVAATVRQQQRVHGCESSSWQSPCSP
jgi:hypothetical protein